MLKIETRNLDWNQKKAFIQEIIQFIPTTRETATKVRTVINLRGARWALNRENLDRVINPKEITQDH